MRVFVTGASGMLGYSLMGLAAEEHEVYGCYRSFPVSLGQAQTFALDLTDAAQVRKGVQPLKPEVIVHTAALTDVDGCERNPLSARRTNVEATKNIAGVAARLGARFIYISTDYVFDGEKGNYVEEDSPNPVNVYGETKLAGEAMALSSCPEARVIRTSIFGYNIQPKRSLVEQLVETLRAGEELTRFSDQFSTPIYAGDLSRVILKMALEGSPGLFHVGGGEKVSRYDFALKVAEVLSLPVTGLQPAPFKHLKGLAKRPRDTSLGGEKVESELGIRLPKVEEGLRRLKKDLEGHKNQG